MSDAHTDRLAAALADRYLIERELGAGGMATVYLAEDLKHDRKVAIKVLRPELAAVLGADRFVQEIKTTAALQHPHILPLFDSGEADGFLYYVMPYIQGETIRDKLNRETQLGIDDAVKITTEVADALDYAHRNGVIHRDIKPENILLHDGRPMVMDFGIALAVSAAAGGRMTETGLSLGTPHYMSPEQATADKAITARSDIYSLASVLYEMLAGEPPHTGSSAQAIIMKIIAEPVQDVTALRKSVPPNVAAALDRSLEKLPADRFESAKAFAAALGDPAFTSARTVAGRVVGGGARAWQQRAGLPLAVTTTLLAVIATWGWMRPAREAAGSVRGAVWLAVDAPAGRFDGFPSPAMSPDGRRIAFFAPDATGARRLWVRDINSPAAQTVTGAVLGDGPTVQEPFWSPDSRSLAFFDQNALYRSDLDGRVPLRLASAPNPRGGTWNADGVILFVPASSGMRRVSASGGAVSAVGDTSLVPGAIDRWPHFLPDGRHFLFLRRAPGAKPAIHLGALDETETRSLLEVSSRAEYADGRIYFARDGALFAQPFDLGRLALQGEAVRVTDEVGVAGGDFRNGAFSAAAGHVVTWTGTGSPMAHLVVVDARGKELRRLGPDASYRDVDLEPSGRRLAVERADGRSAVVGVWLVDLETGQGSVLAAPAEGAGTPRWIPGTSDVLYSTFTGGTMVRQSTATPESRTYKSATAWVAEVTPDGRQAIFHASRPGTGQDVLLLALDGGGSPTPLLDTPATETNPVLSPDGRWIAYTSDESGSSEVIVQAFPGLGNKQVVSSGGGYQPQWSADGRVLYYISSDTTLVATAVARLGSSLSFSRRPMFRVPGLVSLNDVRQTYLPLLDGTFLLIVSSDSIVPDRLRVGLNWAAR